ncbi:uncharacterized protein LOC106522081 [Austrofundulus limnaeus]|uniref:Uncharacterized protein LOC106522081 n=1 Tax=Austrofundulus limnaeus TaxID=52670 RepID=A0A2I4BRL3_AUSLI|nr:PREDICTED: uncharacterized protein LOC106522081 [Austrofundulus limnaeus]
MSAVWLMTATFLCLFFAALAAAEKYKVEWRKVGNSITIQCKDSSGQEHLDVKGGLEETSIIFTSKINPSKIVISPNMTSRIQTHGTFPNVQILIKNLSVEDMGPYWCLYSTYKGSGSDYIKGQGSLLLVVTENKDSVTSVQGCKSPPLNMVVVYVVGAAVVLLLLILTFVMWIIRRRSRPSMKPRHVATNNNDVYEDMRGTFRC